MKEFNLNKKEVVALNAQAVKTVIICFALRCRCFYYGIMWEFYSPQKDERLPMSHKNAFHWHLRSSLLLTEMNVINSF